MRYFEDLDVEAETYFGSYEVTREEVTAESTRPLESARWAAAVPLRE